MIALFFIYIQPKKNKVLENFFTRIFVRFLYIFNESSIYIKV